MGEFEFELTFQIGHGETGERYLDVLMEAGCDDGVVGFGREGVIAIDFSREAATASEAIGSAICAVKSAIPHARLIEVGPDLVGLSDLGDFFGVSRQGMRKFIMQHEDAPVPVHSGKTTLWHLCDVGRWMADARLEVGGKGFSEAQLELAKATLAFNFTKRWISFKPCQTSVDEIVEAAGRELPEQIRRCIADDALRQIS